MLKKRHRTSQILESAKLSHNLFSAIHNPVCHIRRYSFTSSRGTNYLSRNIHLRAEDIYPSWNELLCVDRVIKFPYHSLYGVRIVVSNAAILILQSLEEGDPGPPQFDGLLDLAVYILFVAWYNLMHSNQPDNLFSRDSYL